MTNPSVSVMEKGSVPVALPAIRNADAATPIIQSLACSAVANACEGWHLGLLVGFRRSVGGSPGTGQGARSGTPPVLFRTK